MTMVDIKAGIDIHIPTIGRMLRESLVLDLVNQGSGKIVFSLVTYFGKSTYGVFYLDDEYGPFEVKPNRIIGFREMQSLGMVQRYLRSKKLPEVPVIMDFSEIQNLEMKPVPTS